MPYSRPTLTALQKRIADDIQRNSGLNAHQKGTFENASATSLAGAFHVMYGKLEYWVQQLFDDTADATNLQRRASTYGLTRIPAKFAAGSVDFTGNNGGTVPAGTELQTQDGQRYLTDSLATIAGGVATVAVTAITPGVAANQNASTSIRFVTPVANVAATATVATGGLVGGADIEELERFRARFKERKQDPPQGGSVADYRAWAKAASADVTRVFVLGHVDDTGATEYGSVVVFPITDDLASPVPTSPLLTTVKDYIDQPDVRPIGAKNVYVEAIGTVALDMEFSALNENSAAVQAAIELEVQDLIIREGNPGDTLLLSHLREAISSAAGETDFTLTEPSDDITLGDDEILILGTTTWPGA